VHPDLVCPAGPGDRLQQRRPSEALAHLEGGGRGSSRRGVDPDPGASASERGVHLEPLMRHRATHQGEVSALDVVPLELGGERLVGLVVGGDDEQS
jgi:hypothetical protein